MEELTKEQKQKARNLRRNRRKLVKQKMVGFNKELSKKPSTNITRQFLKDMKNFRRGKNKLPVILIDDFKWLNRKLGKI